MFIIILVLLLWTVYKYLTAHLYYWKKKNVSFEKPLPIFGNVLRPFLMKQTIGDCLKEIYEKTKEPYLGIFILNKPGLLVKDPELIKSILVKDFNYFYNRTRTSDINVDPVGAHFLFNAKSPHWNELRKIVSPIFTSGKLKNMHILMQECANDMVHHLKSKNCENIEIVEILAKYTTEVISSCCFGINANCFKDENAKFRQISRRIFDWNSLKISVPIMCYFLAPELVKVFRLKFINRSCSNFLKEAFNYAMSERTRTGTTRNDLLDMFVQINENNKDGQILLDDQKCLAQAVQFFIAGFETTSNTLAFCLFELSKNPEAQKNLRSEINDNIKEHGELNFNVIKDMKYLDMCINETLRKYPILPFLDRRCMDHYVLPGTEVLIEKDTPLFISLLGLHYDPKYYPEPEKFLPERLSQDDMKLFNYLPFGDGPRNCIGSKFGKLTVKTGLVHLLSNFDVHVCDKTQENIEFQPRGLLLSPLNGITLKIKPIK